jgi:hypothetical protein
VDRRFVLEYLGISRWWDLMGTGECLTCRGVGDSENVLSGLHEEGKGALLVVVDTAVCV